jgi:hypothetical protein
MSMTQAVVIYVILFSALLFGLWRAKPDWKKIWCCVDWNQIVGRKEFGNREFWLKVLLAAFIALCSGISLITFVLPYGGSWVLIGLFTSLLVLALFLPYLLA